MTPRERGQTPVMSVEDVAFSRNGFDKPEVRPTLLAWDDGRVVKAASSRIGLTKPAHQLSAGVFGHGWGLTPSVAGSVGR